jgi:CMP-N,N'-diacetyllegionaminic acid synthase
VNILAVILARAGSAGLKNKHLLPLLGRPVIDYTFDHARAARRLTRVVVSSDCPAIRNAAERKWFETIARPDQLSTSEASVQDVMLHALHTVESRSSFRADGLVVLYGNVPVRPAEVIDEAVSLLETSKCDSVRSFCPVGKWHPSWMSWLDDDRVEPLQAGSIHRRQDLTPLFLHDGAVVAVTREAMLRGEKTPEDAHAFFGVDRRAVRTGMGETVEIDYLRDLYWAEAVLRDRVGVPTRMAS